MSLPREHLSEYSYYTKLYNWDVEMYDILYFPILLTANGWLVSPISLLTIIPHAIKNYGQVQ